MENMKILVINGPNLNMLYTRDKKQYGNKTLDEINAMLYNTAHTSGAKHTIELVFFQSNHEGALIDFIQEHHEADGMIINPGALTHYSYALADALRDFPGAKVEVHLSNINEREDFRRVSVVRDVCDAVYMGEKEQSYGKAFDWLVSNSHL